jgi:general secretion pathway protein D
MPENTLMFPREGRTVVLGFKMIAVLLFATVLWTTCRAEGMYPERFTGTSETSDWRATMKREPIIVQGTGDVIGSPPGNVSVAKGGDITLNFVDAAIEEVAKAVLGDALGLNYLISPKVAGSVTLRTSRPLSRDAVLPVLEAALSVHGAAVVKSGGVYQVVPSAEAPRTAAPVRIPRKSKMRRPGYAVEVVPLKFIGAAEMETVLKPVAPKGSILFADKARNLLLLGGTSDELESMLRMIGIFDVDYMRGMSFALIPIENSNAVEVAAEVERIFNLNIQQEKAAPGPIRFLPIERIRSILVISPDMTYIKHASDWIKTLDRRDETDQKLHVYQVQNGRAGEIAEVLGRIFGAQTPDEASPNRGQVAPGYSPTTIESLPPPSESVSATSSVSTSGQVSLAPPAKRSPTERASEKAAVSVVQFEGKNAVRIVADPNSNQLVIYATFADYQTILSALTKIDIAPMQVSIEATIAEVTLTGGFEYGVQWFFNTVDMSVDFEGGEIFKAIGDGATGVAQAFSYIAAAQSIQATLVALSQQTDVRIIASPNITVRDNQPARIQIGDQVPVLTQQSTSNFAAGAPTVNSVQYIDSGVILEVTPHVNASGLISLDIIQQISQPVPTTSSDIDSPSIQQRLIQTSVSVQSNEVVALGGLISEIETKGGSGIPALRRIPVLGSLFGTKSKDSRRTEIIVLLTPRLIRDSMDAREITYELGQRMRAIVPLGAAIQ